MKRASGALLAAGRLLSGGTLTAAQAGAEAQAVSASRVIKQVLPAIYANTRGFAAEAAVPEADVQVP